MRTTRERHVSRIAARCNDQPEHVFILASPRPSSSSSSNSSSAGSDTEFLDQCLSPRIGTSAIEIPSRHHAHTADRRRLSRRKPTRRIHNSIVQRRRVPQHVLHVPSAAALSIFGSMRASTSARFRPRTSSRLAVGDILHQRESRIQLPRECIVVMLPV